MDWIPYEENEVPANVIESVDSAVLAGDDLILHLYHISQLTHSYSFTDWDGSPRHHSIRGFALDQDSRDQDQAV